ncbi:MAG: TetR/AcrR family transcriptional regulator [Planctomycetota bacterium]|jgi:AcrR family transcriptional regulator
MTHLAKGRSARVQPRRSRESWLEAALEVLSRQGGARIRIRNLCADLGVTTGSFYAHFAGRDDFIRSVAKYWQRRYTTEIVETIRHAPGDPKSRLLALAEGIIEQDLARYDVAVRAWATQVPAVAAIVRQVDKERLRALRDLFTELGLRDAELEMTARTFVTYYGLELSILVRQNKRERLEEARRRIEMFLRPVAEESAKAGGRGRAGASDVRSPVSSRS